MPELSYFAMWHGLHTYTSCESVEESDLYSLSASGHALPLKSFLQLEGQSWTARTEHWLWRRSVFWLAQALTHGISVI
jgi:hypothetical protein